jgi:hypothetical protein
MIVVRVSYYLMRLFTAFDRHHHCFKYCNNYGVMQVSITQSQVPSDIKFSATRLVYVKVPF